MKYRFIQLKDLPKTPAGTVFDCNGIESRWDGSRDIRKHDFYIILGLEDGSGYREIHWHRVGQCIFDDPEWFRKEIATDRLTELKCHACGSTKASLIYDSYTTHIMKGIWTAITMA